ncbi:MAG: prepilin-type N-terminal cleavage/methylation domain-containing protein [Rhizobacter sp.]
MTGGKSQPGFDSRPRGFTLIELLVVLAIVALLLTIVAPRTIDHLDRARETTLKATLKEMRSALDQYEADLGHPPANLDELVQRHYLRELPIDPLTDKRDSWISISPAEASTKDVIAEGVIDVRSGAEGSGRDGTPYRSW